MPKKNSKPSKVQISVPNCPAALKAWLERDAKLSDRTLAAHARLIFEIYRASKTPSMTPEKTKLSWPNNNSD